MAVIVITPNLLGRDGISRLARGIARAAEADVVMSLHDPAACVRFEGARVVAAGGSSGRIGALALQQAARAGAGTIVIVVHVHMAPVALAFAARGAALVTFLCGIEAWAPLTWTQRALVQRSVEVLAISHHTVDRFRERNRRLAGHRVAVCHPGIDAVPPLAPPEPGAPRALIVGRMAGTERYKGHDALLDVWTSVSRAVPGARLDVVGDGDDRPRLEAQARALGLSDAVLFHGSVSDDDRERFYHQSSVFVMPSRDEGFGLVFLEAMRAGRACIATRGSASEIVDDGRTGLLISSSDDRAALTSALIATLGDPPRALAMGRAARERFLDHFTSEHFRARLAARLPRRVLAGADA